MERVLEQLYNGRLYPYSRFRTTIEGFCENRDKAFASYSRFLESLPPELRDEFVQMIDEHLGLLPLELEQNFIDGFCIAARLMIEIFYTPVGEHAPADS